MIDSGNRQTRSELLRRTAAAALGLAGLHGLTGPAKAAALAPSVTTRDEPLGRSRQLSAGWRVLEAREAPPFHLLGLHWQGPGLVEYRTRSAAGAWGEWDRAVEHEQADGPGERGPRGWTLGSPAWVGVASDAVQYRLAGDVRRLRAHFVWSPTVQSRRLATAAAPFIVSRADWGADETIVRADPYYADRLLLAIVHHTAGKAPATPDDSAALIRAIQIYHVESNGWNDIGYNLVVDPFGQAFEGRVGGVERNVVGAHAGGFNAGSCGIALLGNLERETLTTRGARGPRRAAGLEARRRPRRSAGAAGVRLLRHASPPARGVRASRRQLDCVPGREPLLRARRHGGGGGDPRAAQALRAHRHRRRWRRT